MPDTKTKPTSQTSMTDETEACTHEAVIGQTCEIKLIQPTEREAEILSTGGTLPLDASWTPSNESMATDSIAEGQDQNAWFYSRRRRRRHKVVSSE